MVAWGIFAALAHTPRIEYIQTSGHNRGVFICELRGLPLEFKKNALRPDMSTFRRIWKNQTHGADVSAGNVRETQLKAEYVPAKPDNPMASCHVYRLENKTRFKLPVAVNR